MAEDNVKENPVLLDELPASQQFKLTLPGWAIREVVQGLNVRCAQLGLNATDAFETAKMLKEQVQKSK